MAELKEFDGFEVQEVSGKTMDELLNVMCEKMSGLDIGYTDTPLDVDSSYFTEPIKLVVKGSWNDGRYSGEFVACKGFKKISQANKWLKELNAECNGDEEDDSYNACNE